MNDIFLTFMTTSGWIATIGLGMYMNSQIKSVVRAKDRTIEAKDREINALNRMVNTLGEDLRHLRASITDLPPLPRRRGGETAVLGVALKRSVAGEPVPVVTRVRSDPDQPGSVDPFLLGVMLGQNTHDSSPSSKSDDSACSSSSSSYSDSGSDSSSCSSSDSGSSGGGGD